MENLLIGLIMGLALSGLSYLLVRLRKDKVKEEVGLPRWLEHNTRLLGLSRDLLTKILGEGTRLEDDKTLYLSEWEDLGMVQNIYVFNLEDRVEEVVLQLRDRSRVQSIVLTLTAFLGQPSMDGLDYLVWKKDGLVYRIDLLDGLLNIEVGKEK